MPPYECALRTGSDHSETDQRCSDTGSAMALESGNGSPVDNCCYFPQTMGVSRNTMSFALPESMREYIDARVRDGNYGNTSEYLRELIRRDQDQQAAKRLRELIADGLASGEGRPLTDEVIADLRARALDGEA